MLGLCPVVSAVVRARLLVGERSRWRSWVGLAATRLRYAAQGDFGQRIGFDGNHAFWQGREPDFEQSQPDLTRSN